MKSLSFKTSFVQKSCIIKIDCIFVKNEANFISFSGLLSNVPAVVALRPQRSVDLLVVLDFSSYESDTHFDYMVSVHFFHFHLRIV